MLCWGKDNSLVSAPTLTTSTTDICKQRGLGGVRARMQAREERMDQFIKLSDKEVDAAYNKLEVFGIHQRLWRGH